MFFLVTICLIFIDLTSKWAFSTFLGTKSIAILGDYLMLHVVHNTGIAFSLPIEGILLKCITILLIGGIVVYYFWYEKYKNAFLVRISYALILA